MPKPYFPASNFVKFQPETVKRRFPPVVIRHDEREIVHQVRRILQQQAALLERFHHQADVSLLEVSHAAVRQLGAAARCPFAEIALLEQQHVVAAAGRVNGHADAGRAATDDNHVPGLAVRANPTPHFVACHIEKLGSTREFEAA